MPNQGRGGRDRKPPSREVTVSKSLSLLLRHAAEREGLKIDSQGYANVADVLAWQKLKSLKVTFPEIISAVESSDKKRYALCYLPETSSSTITTAPDTPAEDEGEEKGAIQSATATATALASFPSDPDPTHYLIRATQGHSMKSVQAESGLLEKLTLDNPDKLPETVVHGTYHSTWPLILASGGLRCMGRNHAHFATGPALQAVLADISRRNNNSAAASTGGGGGPTGKGKENSGEGSGGQVISGMRGDAQVLIYIDIRKALSRGCPFWRSENGVILSEGMDLDLDAKAAEGGKAIPVDCFDVVVERKKGLGKIWEAGEVIQSLPEELTKKGNPKGGRRR
ncbi:KptA family-domain-containing protein [Aspergillus aurantiobrunneus]